MSWTDEIDPNKIQPVDPVASTITGLSFALACHYLAKHSGESPAYWGTKFGEDASYLLGSDDVHPSEIERICESVFEVSLVPEDKN